MRLAACLLLALSCAGPVRAEPDAILHGAIARVLTAGAEGEVLAVLAGRLAGGVELPEVPKPAALAGGPMKVLEGDVQAALTQLSILAGGNGHLSLQLAQASTTDVIYILSGTATLSELEAAGHLQRRANGWRLSRPLVLWPGAALVLSPGQVLELDTAAGAFVLSFGDVHMAGATLRGDGGQNARVPTFRPFLLVTGQGSFHAARSTFADLGFDGPVAFRGVSVLTGGVMKPASAPVVTQSRFQNVYSLSFEGADGMVVTRNRLSGAGAAAISVKDGRGVTLAGNRISGTDGGAGIRLSGALEDVVIAANVILGGGRNGVQIDGKTLRLGLRANVILNNAGSGISLGPATCVAVQGNIIAGNGTVGLRLTRTGAARVADNAVTGNGSAGIEVEAQAGLGPVLMSDNRLSGNREGLRAAGLGEVRLAGNDLDHQTPRQFAGDFSPWLGAYLGAEAAFVIPAAARAPVPPVPCQPE
ncbi:MAG: right-handed parallel beta-helix repeat-containing protein [Tabrizicola sp.]|uniref:right-handed parallel beta-helix repeat-containing protein n=1 Tax=Tabrizicola sp. TaxID=2005166 RepID=UPI002ABAA889|nr:right-handed parallel beta-helix repeat-containing protein [Tabrizicola sp.]MDZ4086246.1 right-handed parallel beta-helix repeat-containing protein [Tabrizicola sp.]